MTHRLFGLLRPVLAALIFLIAVQQSAFAGTTGGISGVVKDEHGNPVAGVRVTVSAPSGVGAVTTDVAGRFAFLTLTPDTYVLTASHDGYQTVQEQGVTVIADATVSISVSLPKAIRTLAVIPARSQTELVKPGVSTISYTVTAQMKNTVAGPTGNGYLEHSVYGLAQLAPGVVPGGVPGGGIYTRGSDPSQVAYEVDGVPVNKPFDSGNGSTGSAAGLADLQIYTGGGPADSAAESTGGFLNTVMKTGTYPGFTDLHTEIGGPSYDHAVELEDGGATPNRRFSYYLDFFGQNNTQHVQTQFDGADLELNRFNNPVGNSVSIRFGAGVAVCSPDGSDPYMPFNTGGGAYLYPPGGDPGCADFAFPPVVNRYALQDDRVATSNFHFEIPHARDARTDDLQVLYTNNFQQYLDATSINDAGGLANMEFFNNRYNIVPGYRDGVVMAPGVQFGQTVNQGASLPLQPYLFPNSPSNRCANLDDDQSAGSFPLDGGLGAPSPYIAVHAQLPFSCPLGVFSTFPNDLRDGVNSNFSIEKLQYTKNITDTSYLRGAVYETFTNELALGTVSAAIHGTCCELQSQAADYEQIFHDHGGFLQYANQLSDKHLLTATINASKTTGVRWDNTTQHNAVFSSATSLVSFDAHGDPTCYDYITGAADVCDDTTSAGGLNDENNVNITGSVAAGTFIDPTRSNPAYCGVGVFGYPCWDPTYGGNPNAPAALNHARWIVTDLGPAGSLNDVQPLYSTYSVQDQWKPNDRVAFNLGLRLARQTYDFTSSSQSAADNFWYAAARNSVCYDTQSGQPYYFTPTPTSQNPNPSSYLLRSLTCDNPETGNPIPGVVHPDGLNGHFLLTDVAPSSFSNNTFEPNLGATYTFNADTVVRAHIARSSDPVDTAYTEYLNLNPENVALENFTDWFGKGYFGPAHLFPAQTATGGDVSYERHFKGTDMSTTITPFYHDYNTRYLPFALSYGLASAYPGAREKAAGFEIQLRKGRFEDNGVSWLLNWGYLSERIQFLAQPNGKNQIDGDNFLIDSYNALTAQGNRFGLKGAMCYNMADVSSTNPYGAAPAGDCSVVNGNVVETSAALSAGDIVNPYFLMAAQPDENTQGWYDSNYGGLPNWPNVFSGVLNFRHGKFAVAPNFYIQQGATYGGPGDLNGVDPRSCKDNQAGFGTQTTDIYGNPLEPIPNPSNPGLPMFSTCSKSSFINNNWVPIPDPLTGSFAGPTNLYRQPTSLFVGATFSYDVNPRTTARLAASNLFHTCWGGTKTPWSDAYPAGNIVCGYQTNQWYASNFYNGRSPFDVTANGVSLPIVAYPYSPTVGAQPFFATFQVDVKL